MLQRLHIIFVASFLSLHQKLQSGQQIVVSEQVLHYLHRSCTLQDTKRYTATCQAVQCVKNTCSGCAGGAPEGCSSAACCDMSASIAKAKAACVHRLTSHSKLPAEQGGPAGLSDGRAPTQLFSRRDTVHLFCATGRGLQSLTVQVTSICSWNISGRGLPVSVQSADLTGDQPRSRLILTAACSDLADRSCSNILRKADS